MPTLLAVAVADCSAFAVVPDWKRCSPHSTLAGIATDSFVFVCSPQMTWAGFVRQVSRKRALAASDSLASAVAHGTVGNAHSVVVLDSCIVCYVVAVVGDAAVVVVVVACNELVAVAHVVAAAVLVGDASDEQVAGRDET